MLKVQEIQEYIDSLFSSSISNTEYFNESGLTYSTDKEIGKIGYCTNLTLDVIDKAKDLGVDMIITHHDAWEFIYNLKDKCLERLKEYDIAHYYNHLPLDDCNFGTNISLMNLLGLNLYKKNCLEDGFYCGVIGEYEIPLSLEEICNILEKNMKEPVQSWKFSEKKIKRVQILCGAGHLTSDIKQAIESNCDLYITGEKILYSLEYAQLNKLNMIIGSHTFTEIFGVESLVNKVLEKYKSIEAILIEEEHLETRNISRAHII